MITLALTDVLARAGSTSSYGVEPALSRPAAAPKFA
jgi:hypothetical protein